MTIHVIKEEWSAKPSVTHAAENNKTLCGLTVTPRYYITLGDVDCPACMKAGTRFSTGESDEV